MAPDVRVPGGVEPELPVGSVGVNTISEMTHGELALYHLSLDLLTKPCS